MRRVEAWKGREFGVRLGDGRVLGCAAHGDPDGPLVLWFHGTPGSRRAVLPAQATAGPLRIVVVERPGCGRSTPLPGRTVLDFVPDVRELLDALDARRATVAGASGAGPYLAACGYALSERLERVVMVGAAAPMDDPVVRASMPPSRRRIFALARRAPWLLRWTMELRRFQDHPARLYAEVTRGAPPVDRVILERNWDAQVAMAAEALRQGVAGVAWDMHLAASPWGFALEDINAEVHVFQGTEDRHAPPAMGRHLAARIPGARLHLVAGAGHFLHADHWDEIAAACAPSVANRAGREP